MTSIGHIRNDYKQPKLNRSDLNDNPIKQLENWLHDAIDRHVQEPTAMTLSTVNREGFPQSRIVLLKDVTNDGLLTFFTNYDSDKGRQMAENPKVSLNLFWPAIERQVRITGVVEKTSPEVSDRYFKSRPFFSQLAACVSPQSQPVNDRDVQKAFENLQQKETDESLKRPSNWGGYQVTPHAIEFWQGRASRLHDRFVYTKNTEGVWTISRLAP